MNNVEAKAEQIELLLGRLGFERVETGGRIFFRFGDLYVRIRYVRGLDAFVIESTGSELEAQLNLFEDGDIYPVSQDIDELLDTLAADLRVNYID